MRGSPGKVAQAADGLHYPGRRGHGRHYRNRRNRAGAQGDDRDAARQPSARLPGLRRRRRVRTAGHDLQVRRRRSRNTSRSSSIAKSSSGRRWSSSTARAASSATAACASAAKAWTSGRWACRTAASAASSRPTAGDHLDCEECGMCIDICPVGALTSGTYRYKTRPWEMNHVGTVCTHCGDGCKTTLGVRRADDGMEIVRGDNRDKSGINGDFLCIKGRYAFDFANHTDRLTKPLVRQADGKLAAGELGAGDRLRRQETARDSRHARRPGDRRHRLEPHHQRRSLSAAEIRAHGARHQQHRSSPHRRLCRLCRSAEGQAGRKLHSRDFGTAPAILCSAAIPPNSIPVLAWQIRTNVRLQPRAHLRRESSSEIKLAGRPKRSCRDSRRTATPRSIGFLAGDDGAFAGRRRGRAFRDAVRAEKNRCSSSSAPSSAAATSKLS